MKTSVRLFLLLAGSSLAAMLLPAETSDSLLMQEDFDLLTEGDFASQALEHKHISLAKNAGPDGSDAIRVRYIGYERGSERVVFRHPLSREVTAASLDFDVMFDQDFQWVLGGKLHGLGPATPITGGKERLPNGWSARVTFKPDGHCASYLYDQNQEKTYGIGDTSADPVFKKGKWHHVTLQVQLNDPGKSNGSARILIDGAEAVVTEDVRFRGEGGEDTLIQRLLFSTFHGGHHPKNAPVDASGKPVTVHALFDNFRVVEN